MIIFVCPSKGKSCGIARYTSYVEHFLREDGVPCITVPTVAAVLALGKEYLARVKAVVVQHEYGLFDGDVNRKLWAGESTGVLVKRMRKIMRRGVPIVVLMHTVDYLHPKLAYRTSIIARSGAKVMALNPLGAERLGWPFLEHGVPLFRTHRPVADVPPHLMHFGFLSGLKRTKMLFEIAEQLKMPLDINLSGGDARQVEDVRRSMRIASLPHRVTFGFMDEASMIGRWADRRGVFLNPQADLQGYFATSGSTRFAMNFGIPIVCTGYLQHLGLNSVDCVPTQDLALQVAVSLDDFDAKRAGVIQESNEKSIARVYRDLLAGLAT